MEFPKLGLEKGLGGTLDGFKPTKHYVAGKLHPIEALCKQFMRIQGFRLKVGRNRDDGLYISIGKALLPVGSYKYCSKYKKEKANNFAQMSKRKFRPSFLKNPKTTSTKLLIQLNPQLYKGLASVNFNSNRHLFTFWIKTLFNLPV